eukprot:CAMPEP_0114520502 /NCGR_PEP_ID=MMETSP0109-20121206/19611_1 /TAXON_ID=29199 /ORGANISM="Chlorarachnion reptans, Strain CCCM449" /LENGTH=119 /DNA_ID=CAMNT_0001701393 /DNA_START=132 /DNA_END=491 /DNA_ORIENTATION=+
MSKWLESLKKRIAFETPLDETSGKGITVEESNPFNKSISSKSGIHGANYTMLGTIDSSPAMTENGPIIAAHTGRIRTSVHGIGGDSNKYSKLGICHGSGSYLERLSPGRVNVISRCGFG